MTLPNPRQLVASALRCDEQSIQPDSALSVHPSWDSFAHLGVMLELEKYYGVVISDESIRHYETFVMIQKRYDELSSLSVSS